MYRMQKIMTEDKKQYKLLTKIVIKTVNQYLYSCITTLYNRLQRFHIHTYIYIYIYIYMSIYSLQNLLKWRNYPGVTRCHLVSTNQKLEIPLRRFTSLYLRIRPIAIFLAKPLYSCAGPAFCTPSRTRKGRYTRISYFSRSSPNSLRNLSNRTRRQC